MTSSFTCMMLAALLALRRRSTTDRRPRWPTRPSGCCPTLEKRAARARRRGRRARRLPGQRSARRPGPRVGAQAARAHRRASGQLLRLLARLPARTQGGAQRLHGGGGLRVQRRLHPSLRPRHRPRAARGAPRRSRGDHRLPATTLEEDEPGRCPALADLPDDAVAPVLLVRGPARRARTARSTARARARQPVPRSARSTASSKGVTIHDLDALSATAGVDDVPRRRRRRHQDRLRPGRRAGARRWPRHRRPAATTSGRASTWSSEVLRDGDRRSVRAGRGRPGRHRLRLLRAARLRRGRAPTSTSSTRSRAGCSATTATPATTTWWPAGPARSARSTASTSSPAPGR